jgi:hypothetical protein
MILFLRILQIYYPQVPVLPFILHYYVCLNRIGQAFELFSLFDFFQSAVY